MRCCSKSTRSFAGWLPALLLGLWLPLLRPAGAAGPVATPVVHSGLKAATEAAVLDQSLVLLVFSAQWCGPCQQLKTQTLASAEFLAQGGALHLAEIDIDAEQSTARAYGVTAVPTLVLVTPDNKILCRSSGFLRTAELLLWLREGRDRLKAGKWEGTAPGSRLDEFVAKVAADRLDTNDWAQLVTLLGQPDPAQREAAGKLILDQREAAIPLLIEAVTNSYLGVRIAANELLHQLAPGAAAIDPWQAPSDLVETVATLKKWWADTGRLTAATPAPQLDPVALSSIRTAVDLLRGNDPVRRTAAMTSLVAQGTNALPAVREALKKCETTGDQRSLTLLEDVRWAILLPDAVEQRAPGVRSVLARGKSPERQGAAARLGRAGRAAIPALAELVNDADSLVVESAVRALSSIGGKDAIPAMAALLKAADSNLRMTAAQGLGHTKSQAAVNELLSVFDDPNEVVVCTAVSALEEIHAERGYSSSQRVMPPEVSKALKGCLHDPRWRVRASAAEVAGKLQVKDLTSEVQSLLEDTDGFVVKSALGALRQLGAAPEPEKLVAVAGRHPALRGESVELLVQWNTPAAAQAVAEMYKASNQDGRLAILRNLGNGGSSEESSSVWQPLLAQAAAEPGVRLRRAVAEILGAQPPRIAAALVGPLLSDEDSETRSAAAGVVLSVISGERVRLAGSHHPDYSEMMEEFDSSASARKKSSKTNAPPATAEQITSWHKALVPKTGTALDPLAAAAFYVTGHSNLDLPVLQRALGQADKAALARLAGSAAPAALMPRLPWPAAQPVLESLCADPAVFLRLLNYTPKSAPQAVEFLLEPKRFRAAVEPASAEVLEGTLPRLLAPERQQWSLASANSQTEAVVANLLTATNAAWRAAAVYCVSLREDPKGADLLSRAAQDPNPWVRLAGAVGLAQTAKDRAVLEQRLGPLLADVDKRVAQRAALGLLEPETRAAADLSYEFASFEFEKIHAWPGSSYSRAGEQRPLATLPPKPALLEPIRQRLAGAAPEEAVRLALVLAQYGDFTGLDQVLASLGDDSQKYQESSGPLLTAIALSRQPKYVPQLKKLALLAKEESELRRLLQALKGMSGAEARELRLEINKLMRQGSN